MAEWINIDEAMKALKAYYGKMLILDKIQQYGVAEAIEVLKSAPHYTAHKDPSTLERECEVMRKKYGVICVKCEYYKKAEVKDGFLICPASGMEITAWDYCSYYEEAKP